jgi:hypothetical protein
MNYFSLFMALISCCLLALVASQQETFVITKKNKTSGHLKEELGASLEELAHLITQEIQLLACAQQHLLFRLRELIDGDSKGCFSGATHKTLQSKVHEAESSIQKARQAVEDLSQLNNFLKGS